jgi:hypothetical protein
VLPVYIQRREQNSTNKADTVLKVSEARCEEIRYVFNIRCVRFAGAGINGCYVTPLHQQSCRKVESSTEKCTLIESTILFRNKCYLIVKIFQIVRSEHMAAEGDPFAETSTN